jgi:transposase
MLIDPVESENYQRNSSKSLNRQFTNHPTPALVNEFLEETYDVEYSLPSCRRLLKEAGLSYQKPRRTAADSDENDQEAFHDEIKKSDRRWMPQ